MKLSELKTDSYGIILLNDIHDLSKREIEIDNRNNGKSSTFYRVENNNDYIIKIPNETLDDNDRRLYMQMLREFSKRQNDILFTDLPVGAYCEIGRFKGMIIRYYKTGITLNDIDSLEALMKYYLHTKDTIHNLFLLVFDIIDAAYELYMNKIKYFDIHVENIIIWGNKPKFIDFDPYRITFGKDISKDDLRDILNRCLRLLKDLLERYKLYNNDMNSLFRPLSHSINDIDGAKNYIKTIEERVTLNR